MNQPCSKKCAENMICDFCSRYIFEKNLCTYQNKKMEPWYDCNCNMFRCCTLDMKAGGEDDRSKRICEN